ncbi:MAG: hypothetical protein JO340_10325 [Acidobacteriaceae bacterium]|nr:hypothetical protein [Acidobacteriaceae bacterium]
MNTATFTMDEWQILFHETMAALLRAQEAVKRQLGIWGLLNSLWKCGRELKALTAALKSLSEAPDGAIPFDFLKSHPENVRDLSSSLDRLLQTAQQKGLMNRSITAGAFRTIDARRQYLLDYMDALELSLDPEVLQSIEEGRQQIERGDYEVMERLY